MNWISSSSAAFVITLSSLNTGIHVEGILSRVKLPNLIFSQKLEINFLNEGLGLPL